MLMPYLLFFLALNAFSKTSPQIQVILGPKSNEDFDHQFKGCLENSECDQVMGMQLSRWKDLIKKNGNEEISESKKTQLLEQFRVKYGIPVDFYTVQKSQQGLKPMLFSSPCKMHNQKDEEKILRGTAFLKSISQDKAVAWRDQTQMEIPLGEILMPQPVLIYDGDIPIKYQLPLEDQPLYIQNKDLIVLREEDGFFYGLRISRNGDWKIVQLDFSNLAQWEEKKSEVKCPMESKKAAPEAFGVEFCKLIWDEDQKKAVTVKMHQGCAI